MAHPVDTFASCAYHEWGCEGVAAEVRGDFAQAARAYRRAARGAPKKERAGYLESAARCNRLWLRSSLEG